MGQAGWDKLSTSSRAPTREKAKCRNCARRVLVRTALILPQKKTPEGLNLRRSWNGSYGGRRKPLPRGKARYGKGSIPVISGVDEKEDFVRTIQVRFAGEPKKTTPRY